jgi:transcriptional regulator with XRE-family HTH domain
VNIKTLREVREELGIGPRPFAREARVSVSTLQDTEGGRTPRRATAEKYASVLQKYGVDPNEVEEVAEGLGEYFRLDLDPYWALWTHVMQSWEELSAGLVRAGYAESLRERLGRIEKQVGDEGRRNRERMEAEYDQIVEENIKGEQM